MQIISDNINVLRRHVWQAVHDRDAGSIKELVHKVAESGADVIDVNIGSVSQDAEGTMTWLVDQIQEVTNLQLSLDGHTASAIIAGAERARSSPIINAYYVQAAHPEEVAGKLLPYAVENNLEVILPTVEAGRPPLDPGERGTKAEELIEMALNAGLPPERVWVDPVVVHLTGGHEDAQSHASAVLETVTLLKQVFDPPVKVLAGVGYLGAGAPGELRSAIYRPFLAMLAGRGLDAAMVDVLDKETMRDVRLIRAMRNESLYSLSDAELK